MNYRKYLEMGRMNKKIVILIMAISSFTFAESTGECQALASKFKETKSVKVYTSSVKDIAQCFMSHNKYAEGFKWYLKTAERGDTASQNVVASMYYFGDGVKQKDEAYSQAIVANSMKKAEALKKTEYVPMHGIHSQV